MSSLLSLKPRPGGAQAPVDAWRLTRGHRPALQRRCLHRRDTRLACGTDGPHQRASGEVTHYAPQAVGWLTSHKPGDVAPERRYRAQRVDERALDPSASFEGEPHGLMPPASALAAKPTSTRPASNTRRKQPG